MSSHYRVLAPLALTLALLAGACTDRNNDDALSQDSTLARDLELANADSMAAPELSDAPPPASAEASSEPAPRPRPRPASRTPKPAPTPTRTASGNTVERTPRGSEGALATIPSGSVVSLTSNDRVCTNTHKVGDRFTATVSESVTGTNGAVVPAGARAVVQVTELKRSENARDDIRMSFNVLSLSWDGKTYPVTASTENVAVEKVRNSSKGNDAKKVVGGAVVGAILGQVLGKDTKSTVIGAAGGAAAGTAVAVGTANYEGCVPNGGAMQIRLTQPATIQAN